MSQRRRIFERPTGKQVRAQLAGLDALYRVADEGDANEVDGGEAKVIDVHADVISACQKIDI